MDGLEEFEEFVNDRPAELRRDIPTDGAETLMIDSRDLRFRG